MHDSQGEIHPSLFAATAARVVAFVRVVVDEVSVSEVEPMLLQVGFSLAFVRTNTT